MTSLFEQLDEKKVHIENLKDANTFESGQNFGLTTAQDLLPKLPDEIMKRLNEKYTGRLRYLRYWEIETQIKEFVREVLLGVEPTKEEKELKMMCDGCRIRDYGLIIAFILGMVAMFYLQSVFFCVGVAK